MRNQIFIVFDSLRWDIFEGANVPFLKGLGTWKKAYTPATFTLPAHMSFFAGKLPHTLDETPYYDYAATRVAENNKLKRYDQFWRLDNPEAARPAFQSFEGPNLVEGFRRKGLTTLGTGGVSWFNSKLPAGKYLTESFDHFYFKEGPQQACHTSAEEQVAWVGDVIKRVEQPFFLFVNFGETHAKFVYKGCSWFEEGNPYGDSKKCKERQRLCLEYLDERVRDLFSVVGECDFVICSDHGEVMGEDGLWGHGFYHQKIMEVPLIISPMSNKGEE